MGLFRKDLKQAWVSKNLDKNPFNQPWVSKEKKDPFKQSWVTGE